MTVIEINPRWRVQLEGAPEDIELLERLVNQSLRFADDIVVCRLDQVPVLNQLSMGPPSATADSAPSEPQLVDRVPAITTTRWDQLQTVDEVTAEAAAQLRMLSGCLSWLTGSAQITTGTVYELTDGGSYSLTRSSPISFQIRPEQLPSPDQFRRFVTFADADENISALLSLRAPGMDWFTVYKMVEAIEDVVGGETAMRNCPYLEGEELKRAKQMANSARHLKPQVHRPPPRPMTLGEAEALLNRSLQALIAERGTRNSSEPDTP